MDLIIHRPPYPLRTRFIALLSLAGAAISGFLLERDLNHAHRGGEGAPVGSVRRSVERVSRRFANSYLWDKVGADEPLYRRDSIQTGPESSATIQLANGSQIELGEESLVVLDDQSQMALNFLRGTAVVRDTQGDHAVSVKRDGKTEVHQIPARLSEPEAAAALFVRAAGKRSIHFTWAVPPSAEKELTAGLSLEIATDRAFSQSRLANPPIDVRGKDGATTELGAGNYFWRLVGKAGVPASETRRLRIVPVEPLRPTWPADDRVVESRAGASVEFRWTVGGSGNEAESALENLDEGKHWIEVSLDGTFNHNAGQIPVVPSSGIARITGVKADGDYSWRIRSEYPGVELTGPVAIFHTRQKAPEPILLGTPLPGQEIRHWAEPAAFDFSWREQALPASGGSSYQLEIARDSAFQEKVTSKKSQTPSIPARDLSLADGTWYWRIQLLDSAGKVARASASQSFVYGLFPLLPAPSPLVPGDREVFQLGQMDHDPAVSWAPVEHAQSYEVEILLDGKPLRKVPVPGPQLRLPGFKPGEYTWTVRAIDPLKRPSAASAPRRFSIALGRTLPPPSLKRKARVVQ